MYKIVNEGVLKRVSDGAFIPCDEQNKDYQLYQEWVKKGGVVQHADAPPVEVVQPTEQELLLRIAELQTQVEALPE